MKRILCAVSLAAFALYVSPACAMQQARHRHTPIVNKDIPAADSSHARQGRQVVDASAPSGQPAKPAGGVAESHVNGGKHGKKGAMAAGKPSEDEGMVAYSDTTGCPGDTLGSGVASCQSVHSLDSSHAHDLFYDDPLSMMAHMCTTVGGEIVILIIVLFLLLLLLSPVIIIIVFLRYVIRRHNDRVRLAETAIKNGQPVPDADMHADRQSAETYWRKGVRNVSIGIGLFVFAQMIDSSFFSGIGLFIISIGGGQIFIARSRPGKGYDDIDGNAPGIDAGNDVCDGDEPFKDGAR